MSGNDQPNIDRRLQLPDLVAIVHCGEFQDLPDEQVVELLYHAFMPEFDRLRKVSQHVEQGSGPLVGNLGDGDLSPSKLIFGEDFPEVNRTVVGILALKWLLAGDYDSFTAYQPEEVRLRQATFQAFHDRALPALKKPDDVMALIVSLILGDLGKDPGLERKVSERLGEEVNHDEVLDKAIEFGWISGPLGLLSDTGRNNVIKGVKLGAKLNIPQMTQGENVPGSLQGIFELQGDEQAYNLKYLESMFDVAGAGGHLDPRGAVRMIEPVCQSFLLAYPVLKQVMAGTLTVRDAYDEVLQYRARILVEQGFRQLSTDNSHERALLRLCAMGRVAEKPLADLFDHAFSTLPRPIRDTLTDGLSVDGYQDGEAVILYYMPGLFAEALRVARKELEDKQIRVLQSLMRVMGRAYHGSRPIHGTSGSIVERDMFPALKIIRGHSFIEDPTILDTFTPR
jgi:hypothetical protein